MKTIWKSIPIYRENEIPLHAPAELSAQGCMTHNHTCKEHITRPDAAWPIDIVHVVRALKK